MNFQLYELATYNSIPHFANFFFRCCAQIHLDNEWGFFITIKRSKHFENPL